jgi:hypothetical protein
MWISVVEPCCVTVTALVRRLEEVVNVSLLVVCKLLHGQLRLIRHLSLQKIHQPSGRVSATSATMAVKWVMWGAYTRKVRKGRRMKSNRV